MAQLPLKTSALILMDLDMLRTISDCQSLGHYRNKPRRCMLLWLLRWKQIFGICVIMYDLMRVGKGLNFSKLQCPFKYIWLMPQIYNNYVLN